ncbi:hypothetical protein BX667DRAFT_508351 [Coemansia mojavensis]|nr:hypothetical protein BX667DRAFT_508351 [Coemansia mojavensis]
MQEYIVYHGERMLDGYIDEHLTIEDLKYELANKEQCQFSNIVLATDKELECSLEDNTVLSTVIRGQLYMGVELQIYLRNEADSNVQTEYAYDIQNVYDWVNEKVASSVRKVYLLRNDSTSSINSRRSFLDIEIVSEDHLVYALE